MDSSLSRAGGAQANPRTNPDCDGEGPRDRTRDSVDSSQENLLSLTM